VSQGGRVVGDRVGDVDYALDILRVHGGGRSSNCPPTRAAMRGQRRPDGRPFPVALDPFTCNRYEVADFTVRAAELGVRYLGLCCGAGPHHVRAMAEALGRTPPASRYSADMSKHAFLGTDETLKQHNRDYAAKL